MRFELAASVDPRTMIDLLRLLFDGSETPLFKKQIPARELLSMRCIRFRLLTWPPATASRPPAVARKEAAARQPAM
jgi:hypothetical protein